MEQKLPHRSPGIPATAPAKGYLETFCQHPVPINTVVTEVIGLLVHYLPKCYRVQNAHVTAATVIR